jgi:tRNA(Ile)-lysidine synthase
MTGKYSSHLPEKVRHTLNSLGVTGHDRILIGVSGGIDSMVLAALLLRMNYKISVAHVNFQLRGNESDADALLVKNWCDKEEVPYHSLVTDTKAYAEKARRNIQTAAREIRYAWWNELFYSERFDKIATAHHHDDSVETFFINLLRGTGLKGLQGIPLERDHFIRPLLNVTRDEVVHYAREFRIPYRDDSSNEKDDYLRNKIRHHLIPVMKELSQAEVLMESTLHRIRFEWPAWEYAFQVWRNDFVKEEVHGIHITSAGDQHPFLLRWLEDYGFPWLLARDFVEGRDSSAILEYGEFILSKTKDGFYLERKMPFREISLDIPGTYEIGEMIFDIRQSEPVPFVMDHDPMTEYICGDNLEWPLRIRNVHAGDSFQPLGMEGRSKKLQDYMTDLKLQYHEKKKVKLLISGNDIIWVMGMRLDERFRITDYCRKIYKLELSKPAVL